METRKIIVALLVGAIFLPSITFAQTVPSRNELVLQLIASLMEQVKALQAQLALMQRNVLVHDVCFNIDGIQEKIPKNMLRDKKFGCMTEEDLDEAVEEASKPTSAEIETACRKASDLKIAPTETKIAYVSSVSNNPIYAGWAPDTSKELLDYFYKYIAVCHDSYGESCYYGHLPDYRIEEVEKYIPILEDRLDKYEKYQQICGE